MFVSFQIQEEYYRLFKNVPCCFECLRWINAAAARSPALCTIIDDTTPLQHSVTRALIFGKSGRNCLVQISNKWKEVALVLSKHCVPLLKDCHHSDIMSDLCSGSLCTMQTCNSINVLTKDIFLSVIQESKYFVYFQFNLMPLQLSSLHSKLSKQSILCSFLYVWNCNL